MRYQIERTLLSNRDARSDGGVTTRQTEAADIRDALTRALLQDHAELVDEIYMRGAEAVAAARQSDALWMYRIEELRR